MLTSCDQSLFEDSKDNYLLLGTSEAVQRLSNKINVVTNSDIPILINGASGSGKTLVAFIIHENMIRQSGSFIVSDCQYWQQSTAKELMKELWEKAKGGSLLLKNIDALDIEDAQSIKSYWFEENRHHPSRLKNDYAIGQVRLMVSSGALSQQAQQRWHINHSFMAWLDYHSLSVELTPLANRPEDIPILTDYFRQCSAAIKKLSFSSDSWQIFESYSWPGNIKQLQRCLEKLSVLVNDQQIDSKLLLKHFPAMNPRSENLITSKVSSNLNSTQSQVNEDEAVVVDQQYSSPISFSTKLIASSSKTFHPALIRALKYIDENFTANFSMSELAGQAYVSPSHLSSLFKKQLGHSFKQVLLRMRIDEAVKLFNIYPDRHVTQVCDDVGFSDLSFFEKKFKVQVGVSPGVYRDKHCKPRQLHTIN